MKKSEYIKGMEDKIRILETQVRHLTNDLRLTREEDETSTARFFELYSHMERKVEEKSRNVIQLQSFLKQKSRELEIMLDSSPAMVFFKDSKQR